MIESNFICNIPRLGNSVRLYVSVLSHYVPLFLDPMQELAERLFSEEFERGREEGAGAMKEGGGAQKDDPIQARLDESSQLLSHLQSAQRERLSRRPPGGAYCAAAVAPSGHEIQLGGWGWRRGAILKVTFRMFQLKW